MSKVQISRFTWVIGYPILYCTLKSNTEPLIDLGYALTVVIVGSYDNGVFVTVKESIPTPLK